MTSTTSDHTAPGAASALEAIRSEVRALSETLWAARPARELTDTVVAIESLKSTLDALELVVVAELEATNGVKPEGWASTRDFLTAVTGGHLGTGPQLVRLAADLPPGPLHPGRRRAGRRVALHYQGRRDHPRRRRPAQHL